MTATKPTNMDHNSKNIYDVIVVGAGFSGLYLIHKMRQIGLTVKVFEKGDDVGGTWFWNRYPGARCDIESIDYSFGFDPELEQEWEWSERYATQPEILRYTQHVAERFDLRRDISFETRVEKSAWDEKTSRWTVETDNGETFSSQYFIMASGCLSQPKDLDIDGIDQFAGEIYKTHSWPHEGVDFTGKRVAVIGTGSSGIQTIPLVAEQAESMVVFQRTACYSLPARNGPIWPEKLAVKSRYREYREEAKWSKVGVPGNEGTQFTMMVSEQERQERYEELWNQGAQTHLGVAFADTMFNLESNETLSEFVRQKIRDKVDDPKLAELLTPTEFPICTKRACLDTNYFETFNKESVELVNIKSNPITSLTEDGIATQNKNYAFDAVIFATGFDAMTGALLAVDIVGKNGQSLKQKWADGPYSYLGLAVEGFPNFFTITGPGSPSVISNMILSIEQHVDWIADCMQYMEKQNFDVIETTETAENGWVEHAATTSQLTLFPLAKSWYMGANVPGKTQVCLPYLGGVDAYRHACNDVAAQDYLGFAFSGPQGSQCNDGIVCAQQPDVLAMLRALEEMNLPPFESISAEQAREISIAMDAATPPGPEVGEVVDAELPGAAGALNCRLYRPATPGPHPITVYFHGGGWVLGSHTSDDAYCRDLCCKTESLIISVNYRHAPENPFPAAVDDGLAAVNWIAENYRELGGLKEELAVCGWSAGGNIAAVTCQLARNTGGAKIIGQVLITPVVNTKDDSPSMTENGEGFVLSKSLMHWFIDNYVDPADRGTPKASPLLAEDLSNLPPTLIVTAEFDPLRDQGIAYAEALAKSGNQVEHINYAGQIHTSFISVALIPTANEARQKIADTLHGYFNV